MATRRERRKTSLGNDMDAASQGAAPPPTASAGGGRPSPTPSPPERGHWRSRSDIGNPHPGRPRLFRSVREAMEYEDQHPDEAAASALPGQADEAARATIAAIARTEPDEAGYTVIRQRAVSDPSNSSSRPPSSSRANATTGPRRQPRRAQPRSATERGQVGSSHRTTPTRNPAPVRRPQADHDSPTTATTSNTLVAPPPPSGTSRSTFAVGATNAWGPQPSVAASTKVSVARASSVVWPPSSASDRASPPVAWDQTWLDGGAPRADGGGGVTGSIVLSALQQSPALPSSPAPEGGARGQQSPDTTDILEADVLKWVADLATSELSGHPQATSNQAPFG